MDSNEHKPNQSGVINVTTTVQKWGNSLGIRIPKDVAQSISLKQGSEIEIIADGLEAKIKPMKKKPTLEDLVQRITPENQHREIDFGMEGKELL